MECDRNYVLMNTLQTGIHKKKFDNEKMNPGEWRERLLKDEQSLKFASVINLPELYQSLLYLLLY